MKEYTFAHILREKEYIQIPVESYTSCWEGKRFWVEKYLEPTVKKAGCGWESVKYVVMRNDALNITEEYMVLAADINFPLDGRYIQVTGNSKGAIMCAVANNLW